MEIALGSDHAGWKLKQSITSWLKKRGYAIFDTGCPEETTRVDYPDYAASVARRVARGQSTAGILCCGTGIGMSIAANKIKGIRAAVAWNRRSAELARNHNAANILCLGGRMLKPSEALSCLEGFLSAKPSPAERHKSRIKKIAALDKSLSQLIVAASLFFMVGPLGATQSLQEARQEYGLGHYEKTVSILESLLPGTTQQAQALLLMGHAQTKLEQWENAASSFEKAVEADPEFIAAYLKLGFLYEKLRDESKAKTAWTKVQQLAQDNKTRSIAKKHLANLK